MKMILLIDQESKLAATKNATTMPDTAQVFLSLGIKNSQLTKAFIKTS